MPIKKILCCLFFILFNINIVYCSDIDMMQKLFENEKYKEALSYAEKILKEENNLKATHNVDVLIIAGKCCYQLWEIDNAIEYYNNALEINNNRKEEIISLIAETYFVSKNFKKSEEIYKHILKEYPNIKNKDEIYFYLAKSLKNQKKIDETKLYFNKLIQEYPESKYFKKAKFELENIN